MTREVFEAQAKRLRETYGDRNYPASRLSIFWHALKNLNDEAFTEAITDLIANCRSAPLHKEIDEAIQRVMNRRHEAQLRGVGGFDEKMTEFARKSQAADKDFVQACITLLGKKLRGEIKMDHFLEGCTLLDRAAMQLSRPIKRPETDNRSRAYRED